MTPAPRPTRSNSLSLLLALLTWLPLVHAGDVPDDLLARLQAGGYHIYFRHAATDWSQQDRIDAPGDWPSCDPSVARQLSDSGRATAAAIGESMRALSIPASELLASPYCRTMETARLLGYGEPRATTDVLNLRVARFVGGREQVLASARRLLGSLPPGDGNRIVVAHGNVAREATPVYPGEAEAVIFRPRADGGFDVVGRVEAGEWRPIATGSVQRRSNGAAAHAGDDGL